MDNFNIDIKKIKKLIHKRMVTLIICSVIVIGLVTTFAYIIYFGDNSKRFNADLSTGTMALIFEDRDNGINASLTPGETITKKFTIENTGTLMGNLSFEWVNMVNTYGYESLSYNLEYCKENCESEDAIYTKILDETNVPVSSKPITQQLASEISVPAGQTYYYNLNLKLNDLENVDQTADLNATFTTNFQVGEASKYRYYTLSVNPNGGIWKNFIETQEYKLKNGDNKEIPIPTREGYNFDGWDVTGVASYIDGTTFTMGMSDTLLVAKWNIKKYTITINIDGDVTTKELGFGESFELEPPSKEGKTFLSWDVSGGIIEGNKFTLTDEKNVTINAIFNDNVYNYKVIHRLMNIDGTGYDVVDTETGSMAYGETLNPVVKSYVGFTSPERQSKPIGVDDEVPSKNVIIYDYIRNKYTLTIDSNGGDYSGDKEVLMYFGSSITLNTPFKDGHVFGGWDNTSGEVSNNKFTIGAENAQITAKWLTDDFDYIINHQLMNTDGTTYTTVESETGKAEYGAEISSDVKNYVGFTSPLKTSITITSDNTKNVLNYKYIRNKYNLVINPNGGSYDESTENTVKSLYYESVLILSTPVKDGYTFTGWSNEGGTLNGSTITMSDTNDVTLTANWSINAYTVTVNYYQMNLDGTTYTLFETDEVTKDFGTTFTPTVKDYVGFTAPSSSTITVGSDISNNVVNYYYSRNQYTLTINPFGGIYNDSEDAVIRKLYYDESVDLGVASKVGYNFSKWKKTTSDNGELNGNVFTMKDSDITLSAVYSPKTFTITFNANGGVSSEQSKVVSYDGIYDELPVPEYEGYEFLGWFTDISDGEEITASTKVKILEDQTLYAHWRYGLYTVTFDANGGEVDVVSKDVTLGQTYGDLPIATKNGYNFLGWYTNSTGGEKIDSDTEVTRRENHTLFAHFSLTPGPDSTLKILGNTVKDGNPNFALPSPPETIIGSADKIYTDFTNVNPSIFVYDETDGSYTITDKTSGASASYSMTFSPATKSHFYMLCDNHSSGYDNTTIYVDNVVQAKFQTITKGLVDLGEIGPENVIRVYFYKYNHRAGDYFKFYIAEEENITTNDDSGMYSMEDDYGTSYYFRGGIENNYVKFAGLYWRIVRMNGDGSLRIMYDGAQAYDNGVSNVGRLALSDQIWNVTYNNDNKYLGYMYGGANGTASTNRDLAQANETNSNTKSQLENWYYNNIAGYGLDQYVSDNIFCNDRNNASSPKTWWTNEGTAIGFSTYLTAYGAFPRFLTTGNAWNTTNPSPTFKCTQKNDSFTKNDAEKGNARLTQKVGTITADEIVAAGSGINTRNTKYYLYKGSVYFSMSPRNYNNGGAMFGVNSNGAFTSVGLTAASGLVPVINLSPEYVVALKGTGTATDPFQYSSSEIKITFDANGGTSDVKGMFKEAGETYGTLPVLKRNGYVFDGWYTSLDGGEKIETDSIINNTADHTIYAHWSPYVDSRVTETLKTLNINPNTGTPTYTTVATTDEGVYSLPDDYGNSYYYRGAVEDNYVFFANLYWRIIRVNGDGSLRIIYDGTDFHANGESNIDRLAITSKAYNSVRTDNKYLGYMYGPNGTAASTSSGQAQSNEANSNLKTELENWYKNNILDKGYDSYVSDSIFCNDRSIPGKEVSGWSSDTGFGFGTASTAYASFVRLGGKKTPQFTCSNKNDRFTKNDTELGNGNLEQKVGTITGDEVYAAGGVYGTSNTKYYLYKGSIYWTMSPYDYIYSTTASSNGGYVMTINASGNLSISFATVANNIAPVINLSYDYVSNFHGTGSTADPYRQYNEDEIVVSLDAGDITIKPNSLIKEVGEVYGDLPTPVKTGYTFDGWYTESDGGGTKVDADTVITISNDHTLYANMVPNTYTVSLNGNGITSVPSSITVTYDSTYGVLPTLEREGYTFTGWYTSTSSGTKITEDTKVTITANQTLYARWTANKYTLTYDPNTGTCTTASKTVTFGSTYSTLATPTKTGYNFLGWYTLPSGGTKITSSSYVTTAADHTLYAQWSLKNFTITFNANGGKNDTGVTSNVVYWGETYGYLPYVYRDGYQFDGWYTAASGGTKIESSTIVNLAANQTLYAHWIGNNYTVNFDANHGIVDTTSMTVTMGANYGTLPTPTNKAGSFLGWYTAKTGGTKVINTTKVSTGSNHTLYAHWSVSSGINITLSSLNINANSGSPNFNTFSTSNEGVYTMADPYGTSYYYRGDITNNYVKYGKWSPDTSTIMYYYSNNSIRFTYSYNECIRYSSCKDYIRADKDMYWRIVRVNGDGSLRIIYDGTEPHANDDESFDRVTTMTQAFNVLKDDAKYVGYMYGPANTTSGTTTASTTKAQAQTNTVDSDMKKYLEEWYSDNLLDYDHEIADKIFCNDRSIVSGNGYGMEETNYGASRFVTGSTYEYPTGEAPRFTCPQKNDSFTKSDTSKGNGKLKQKVGLITVDELIAAGLYPFNTQTAEIYDSKSYLRYEEDIWTMSPKYFDDWIKSSALFYTLYNGKVLGGATSPIEAGVAPVINLQASIVPQFYGSGTKNDPYYLK